MSTTPPTPLAPSLTAGYDPSTGTVAPNSAAPPSVTPSAPKGIPMLDDKGAPVYVPAANAQKAIDDGGYKLSVNMTDPQGKQWHVPFDQQDRAQKEGHYTWDADQDNAVLKQYATATQQKQSVNESRSGQTGKALVPTPDGKMIEMDVPAGQESSIEKASDVGPHTAGATALTTLGSAALIGPALDWLGVTGAKAAATATQKTGTGILDQYGNEIFHDVPVEVKQTASKILQNPAVRKAIKVAVGKFIGEEAGRRIGSVAGTPGQIAGGTLGATLGDHVLNFILGE
jgi:hypothetical protein